MSKKTKQFRELLLSKDLEFLLEAHNGISAKIGEEAGFKGLWASGLAISAQYGVRDSNEASWTQVLENIEFMSDASNIPIMLDGDTGYGNFNNIRRLVTKLEQRDIAGVCIEDKQFPKINSFIDSDKQPLADVDEFCGKIKAGKDCQVNDDFCIVARVEALIAGWGLKEALNRAESYRNAGADAIFAEAVTEIEDYKKFSENLNVPILANITEFGKTPLFSKEDLKEVGVDMILYPLSAFRAMSKAAEGVYSEILEKGTQQDLIDRMQTRDELYEVLDYHTFEKKLDELFEE